MSCDYEIRCKTCNSTHSFNDANHQDDLMRSLVSHHAQIAALVPLFDDPRASCIELKVWCGSISPHWFAAHLGHELAVFDEYGREDGGRLDCFVRK